MESKTLYQRIKEAGCEISSHESDLYVRYDEKAAKIVDEYRQENGLTAGWGLCSFFTNQVEGGRWLDVPFAFDPFWEARLSR